MSDFRRGPQSLSWLNMPAVFQVYDSPFPCLCSRCDVEITGKRWIRTHPAKPFYAMETICENCHEKVVHPAGVASPNSKKPKVQEV